MKSYSGPFLSEDGFVQTEIRVEEGEVKELEEGGDGGKKAIMIPTFYDSHTHLADSVVKKPPAGSIEEIVGPGGLKEKKLSSSTGEELSRSITKYLKDALSYGVNCIFDFREGGIKGLEPLKKALDSLEKENFTPVIMARPANKEFDAWELNNLLSQVDGIGLSSYRDWEKEQIKKVADTVRGSGKPLAMHCSEDVREPIEDILDLNVHHLVHLLEATEDDLHACAEEEVPVVICPRANMFFGKIPDIPKMMECDLTLSLGTDNAMITDSNIFREMETAYRVGRLKGEVPPEDILMMATWNPRKSLKPSFDESEEDFLMILDHKEGDPAYNVVTRSTPGDIIGYVKW